MNWRITDSHFGMETYTAYQKGVTSFLNPGQLRCSTKRSPRGKSVIFRNPWFLCLDEKIKNKNLSVLILSCLCFLFLASFLLSLRPVGGGPNPIGNLDRGSPYPLADLDWWSKPAGAQTRKETGIGNPVGASEFILGFICNCFKNYFLTAKISFTCVPNLVSFNTS